MLNAFSQTVSTPFHEESGAPDNQTASEFKIVVTKLPQQQVAEFQASQRLPELRYAVLTNDSSTGFYKYPPFGSFLGNNSFYIEDNDGSLNLTQFTLSAWFRTGEGIPSNDTRQYLITKGGTGSDFPGENMNYGISFRKKDATIRGGFEDINGTNYSVASRNPVNDTQWHYVTITYNGSDLIMYLDGKQIDIEYTGGSVPDNTETHVLNNETRLLFIGGNIDDKDFFIGDMDEIRLWDRALAAKEVKQAYEKGIFPTEGQVLHLPFS
ncbi:MAG TPA: LamG domain-containing protein [Candidatus Nitrosocosmicus sp.]|nr:LamG domain-containing protein [Candidatus Nitrosocosmicus sp.]